MYGFRVEGSGFMGPWEKFELNGSAITRMLVPQPTWNSLELKTARKTTNSCSPDLDEYQTTLGPDSETPW